ncbi:S-layer homology domain-containing protein [Paenibacillus sp. LHD-38]|uniref:S-layer homology domain-containing protein n=1 Tax=Paenibacillus sp. LHD-38 TaxID=3072143 RepID=UPI00280F9CB6|nr:S-layer homology domain-containing protein [Paenibacillus sp. LHD-38]MDQ8738340.1 S-layer homology domain-containing protein [Paenibacillus sp. LHD-38]
MTLRKKLAVSTIAASVALTAFAGIPLSNKGLAEKLGVNGVAYASSLEDSQLVKDVKKLYDALVATGGLPKVKELQDALDGLAIHVKGDIVAPIVDKFQPSASEETQLENLFYDAVSLSYNPSVAGLEALRAEHGALLQSFATEAGVTDLTVDDIALYFFDIQEELVAQVGSKDLAGLLDIMTNSSSVQQLLRDVLAALPESEYNVEKIFLHYGVNTNDVLSVLTEARAAVNNDSTFTAAAGALFTAYKSLNSSGGGGGGGGIIITPTAPLPETTDKLLNDLKAALDKATEAEKAALITKFVTDATAEITKLATISAASNVSNVNGKAVLQLNESNLLSVIAGIDAVAAKVKELAPGSAVQKTALKFDLGAVTLKDVVLNLPDAVVKAAAAGNVSGATFVVGGFEVTVPVGGSFSSAISLAISKTDASAAVVGTLKPVSEVYDFNLTIGGVAKTTFDQPIVISLPLGDTTGLDKELLSVAKIVDGKLVFHGGRVSGNSIIESRDSFSSYVVVENKVSFTDIAKVEAWAGREIQVVAAKGAIEGKSEGKFVPQDKVTRAEFAKMLIRALDLENGSATEAFADVDAADWFAPYVAAAAQLKIINGRSASKFDPNATITRAEMATMIARALKVSKGAVDVTDVDAALKGFADAGKINATLKDGVAFAATHKIVIGNAGKFLPKNNATRAEAAVIIYRALNFDK